VVNTSGQVMHISGKPIEGLYAAGNVMAGVTGPGYGGAGGTIGPGMTWGYIAARHAAGEQSRRK
ncbi:MAG: FAD-binding protein, partial [Chloroflexi bacterium]|nr:FAD-binding protein [Chloroflexota bacterium]